MRDFDLLPLLDWIDPTDLNYQDWVTVGMGLKEAGYSAEHWDEWSRRDYARYHPGECEKKWNTFQGSGNPVTGGTIVQMARDRGWSPGGGGYALDWDSDLSGSDGVLIDAAWVERREVDEPKAWDPAGDLIRYLECVFDSGENVGYVTESWDKDGKRLPTKGFWKRTAGELIQELSRTRDVGAVMGDYDPEAGAWIRFNPLDGKGVKNENVTDYRFALVESDTMEIEQQNAIIRELELPVAALVYSGGKSIHAIVHIDAGSYEEYRKRVDYLYSVLKKNGMEVDTQNKNPSRLSRMPGVTRNGKKQFLIDTNIGKASWNEWKEWIEAATDDLPEPEELSGVWDNLPDLAPPLIDGVLRQGHKMLLAGPSKAGKSYALIELCIAIAEGRSWLGFPCEQGRVLYVNLELDRASCLHRFRDVYEALGQKPDNLQNLTIWNLRGRAVPMDKLAPKLIRRCLKKNYTAIIIDPIYKIITGDENSADQMAAFCNQFDKVCNELSCAVVYCHHHSKGVQGQKRSMDRASGSGVFARDPDAMLDLIELDVPESVRTAELDKVEIAIWEQAFAKNVYNWRDSVSQDDQCSACAMRNAAERLLEPGAYRNITEEVRAAQRAAEKRTAWRIEGTLREFASFPPLNLWFDYPVHRVDDTGLLADMEADGGVPKMSACRGQSKKKEAAEDTPMPSKKERLETAFAVLDDGSGKVSRADLMEYLGKSRNTVNDYIDSSPKFKRDKNGMVSRVSEVSKT